MCTTASYRVLDAQDPAVGQFDLFLQCRGAVTMEKTAMLIKQLISNACMSDLTNSRKQGASLHNLKIYKHWTKIALRDAVTSKYTVYTNPYISSGQRETCMAPAQGRRTCRGKLCCMWKDPEAFEC